MLVVDDNATSRKILEETLVHWDMQPISVDGGRAALTALDRARETATPFDLVLLDAQIPEMDGFMLAEEIGLRPGSAGVTILTLASGGQPGDAARCKKVGFAAYLTKPVKQAESKVGGPSARKVGTFQCRRVEWSTGGRNAVPSADSPFFDAILMDVQMPEMDGQEAAAIASTVPGSISRSS